ncbi:hypothetical protein ACWDYH_39610 [Nocardia goodfellowii]
MDNHHWEYHRSSWPPKLETAVQRRPPGNLKTKIFMGLLVLAGFTALGPVFAGLLLSAFGSATGDGVVPVVATALVVLILTAAVVVLKPGCLGAGCSLSAARRRLRLLRAAVSRGDGRTQS